MRSWPSEKAPVFAIFPLPVSWACRPGPRPINRERGQSQVPVTLAAARFRRAPAVIGLVIRWPVLWAIICEDRSSVVPRSRRAAEPASFRELLSPYTLAASLLRAAFQQKAKPLH